MLTARITGIGWVTAKGTGSGRSRKTFALSGNPLPELKRADVFDAPDRRFGRLDPFSRTGLAAIAFALRDAGLEEWDSKRRIGLVAATTYGCLATDSAYFDTVLPEGGALASPQLFAYTLANTFLGEASIRFGLTGGGMVINDPQPGGLTPLGMALESLAWDEEDCLLAGISDLSTPGGLPAVEGVPAGAVFLVLEKKDRSGVSPFGTLSLSGEAIYSLNGKEISSVAELVETCLESL